MLLNNNNIAWHKYLGQTPSLPKPRIRGQEIERWIKDWTNQGHEPLESFVIIDDDPDMGDLTPKRRSC
jgi:hypothetical protein